MNDDELVDRLRRALHTEADALTPGHGTPRVTPVAARPKRRSGWRNSGYILLAVAAVVAAGVVIAVNLNHRQTSVGVITSAPTTVGPSRTGQRASQPPVSRATKASAVGAVASDFVPLSVTFVSPSSGWLLGVQRCDAGATCLELASTTSDANHWQAKAVHTSIRGLQMPTAANRGARPDLQVRFANPQVGWIYGTVDGTPILYWTSDGGAAWVSQSPADRWGATQIEGLEASHGKVHVVFLTAGGYSIASSPAVGKPRWTSPPLDSTVAHSATTSATLTLQGTSGWVLQRQGPKVAGGAELVKGTWRAWAPALTSQAGPALLAASSPSDLVAVSGPAGAQHYDVSTDGGRDFHDLGTLATPDVTALASGSPASTVVGTGAGALYHGSDSGVTSLAKASVSGASAGGRRIVQTGFENANQGVAVTATEMGGQLLMTFDGGRSWSGVDLQR